MPVKIEATEPDTTTRAMLGNEKSESVGLNHADHKLRASTAPILRIDIGGAILTKALAR